MSVNKRIFYAISQLGMAVDGTSTFVAAHGVQSVGITTTFNLEQAFELGQIQIYEIIENVPDVEVTAEKVIDGYPLLYHLATSGSAAPGLTGRQNAKTTVALSIFPDSQQSASGTPLAEVHMSGMVVSSLQYTIPTEGNCTESVTLVGNHKLWIDVDASGGAQFSGAFPSDADQPATLAGSGYGVQRRQHVIFSPLSGSPTGIDENSMTNAWATVLPTDIYGITSSGTNPANADGTLVVPVQSIQVQTDLGREPIYELGRKNFYFRYITFPVEVRTDIEVNAIKYDNISATEQGGQNGAPAGYNLKNQTIRVQLQNGTRLDMGTRNKLQSVSWGGGDAGQGGGNVTNKYSYLNYNILNVYSPADPSALSG